ncbi:MAG TPA: baseplate J/gp47 family protein [Candidatus Angelobacter sp.]
MSNVGIVVPLNSCGCCESEPQLTPISNRPGLTALSYRIGTYGSFLQRLLDEIRAARIPDGPHEGSRPLASLTTRASDDPAIALLDAWAIVADVLTFYQERIANEGYLRTATERRSVLELARAIGYELSPGVAASVYLQFSVEEIIATAAAAAAGTGARVQVAAGPGSSPFNSGLVNIPKGTQVQSVPAPGQLPQTFETSSPFTARVEWNRVTPRLTRPPDLALSNGKLYLLGTSTSFAPGTSTSLPLSGLYLLNAPPMEVGAAPMLASAAESSLVVSAVAAPALAVLAESVSATASAATPKTASAFLAESSLQAKAGVSFIQPAKSIVKSAVATGLGRGVIITKFPGGGFKFPRPPKPTPPAPSQMVPAVEVKELFLKGTNTNLKSGDRLLLVGTNNDNVTQAVPFIVRAIEADSNLNRTRVVFADNPSIPSFTPPSLPAEVLALEDIPFTQDNVKTHILEKSIDESTLQAFLQMNGWNAQELMTLINGAAPVPEGSNGAFAFRANGGFFGHNAPLYRSLPDPKYQRQDPYPLNWDVANNGTGSTIWTDSQQHPYSDAHVFLERTFPQVVGSGWTLFESPARASAAYKISGVVEKSLSDYGLSGKSTGLKLDFSPNDSAYDALSGSCTNNPAVVSWGHDRLDVFVVGSVDHALYHKWWDGSQWGPSVSDYEYMGGIIVGDPAVASWDHDRLDVFVVGLNGGLFHKAWNGAQWLPSVTAYDFLGLPKAGVTIRGNPKVVSWDHDRLDIFVVGSDGALYHKWWDGSQWGPSVGDFEYMGGVVVGDPAVASWGHDRLDVFVVGTDGALYHKAWDGAEWFPFTTGYERLGIPNTGITIRNSPTVTSWQHDRLDVFVVGTDGALYHKWWDGFGWGPSKDGSFEYMGGFIIGDPTVASWDHDRLDVFVVGADRALYHKEWNGSEWLPAPTGYENLGGFVISNPAVASWAHDRLDVFVTGGDTGLYHKAWDGTSWSKLGFLVRKTTAYVQSEQLGLVDFPVVDDISAGTSELMLNELLLGLTPGQPVALVGMQADASGVSASEILIIKDIVHVGGFTVLTFSTGLQHSYLRSTVTINANVALATHGATVQEVLGDGDGSQTSQTFVLKRPPLTYVSAPTPRGIASTLEVRVNDLKWDEAPAFYGLNEKDEEYVVRIGDGGTPAVSFGDPASRLKTARQNIRATYRTGIGVAGNVDAGTLSMLQSRPPGLRGVTNPLPAAGGADPQNLAHARANAPLTVVTLDRIVSLDDYENFVASFAGIGKAQATAVWSGETRLVHITIADASGGTIGPASPLYRTLLQGIRAAHDPVQQIAVTSYQPLTFDLVVGILIDPKYLPDVVLTTVRAKLADAFSFPNQAFAEPVTAAEIASLIQAVPGVVASTLKQLYLSTDLSGPSQTEPPPYLLAAPARLQGAAILPAQLLLLNPLGAKVTEIIA